MKLKQKFVLREIAGDYILIPVVSRDDKFQGMMTLNETSAFIWKKLEAEQEEPQIVEALLEEYEVSREKAEQDVGKFCSHLAQLGIL